MKVRQLGGSKLELPLRIGVVLDQFNDRIELFKAVPGLYARSLVGVGNQLGIESLAMPVLVPRPPLVVIPSGARNLLLVALATPPLDRLSPGSCEDFQSSCSRRQSSASALLALVG
jgi:hypothetical protein